MKGCGSTPIKLLRKISIWPDLAHRLQFADPWLSGGDVMQASRNWRSGFMTNISHEFSQITSLDLVLLILVLSGSKGRLLYISAFP